MKIRIKKREGKGLNRVEGEGKIDKIEFKKDLFEKELDNIEICFRGLETSGIINLEVSEAKDLYLKLSEFIDEKKKVRKK